MQFLSRLLSIATICDSPSLPLIILKMIELTVSYGEPALYARAADITSISNPKSTLPVGLSPSAPVALVSFGSYLGRLGNISAGKKNHDK